MGPGAGRIVDILNSTCDLFGLAASLKFRRTASSKWYSTCCMQKLVWACEIINCAAVALAVVSVLTWYRWRCKELSCCAGMLVAFLLPYLSGT
ncbi:hypothetical protein OH492_08725 [Vibrio chagasii]|nr:hypothetical protein [Vibrio chagasii]